MSYFKLKQRKTLNINFEWNYECACRNFRTSM